MKNIILFAISIISYCYSFSQITINYADMPEINDTFRISLASNTSIDFELTGEDYFWDFSELVYESQTIDSFIHINETPFTYNLVFIYPFVSTIAKPSIPPQVPEAAPITITESYDFFKESSSEFTKTGFAAKINDLPTPRKYDNPELLYTFPLTYGSQADSSLSSWELELPTYGLYGQTIKRVNTVDGYGSLTTPFGTFDCIRLKSVVNSRDTFYIETYGIGYAVDRPELTEYKWLANGYGIPVLQIEKTNLYTNIRYIDSARVDLTTIRKMTNDYSFNIFPNPAKDHVFITDLDTKSFSYSIFDITGCKMESGDISNNKESFRIDLTDYQKGLFFIRIFNEKQCVTKTFIVQ